MPPKKSKKGKKSTKGAKGTGTGATAVCDIDDVCDWLSRVAPNAPLGPYPQPNPMTPRPASPNWLKDMWQCYVELYMAVVRLEKVVHCNDTSANVGGPFIINCPGGGGGPTKGGAPPPPPFP
jgi:hypothetical protein